MYYDDDSNTGGFLAGVAIGAILGAGLALLVAPDSGGVTRARLVSLLHDDADDVAPEDIEDEEEEELDELDRESIMAVLNQRRRR